VTPPEPPPTDPADAPPLHGYRGVETPAPSAFGPMGATVAVGSEAGSRGVSVATAVAARLGWDCYPPDALDVLSDDPAALPELLAALPPGAAAWATRGAADLVAARNLADDPAAAVARLVFALAAKGKCVLIGRGAGFVLPAATTVHLQVVAPFAERGAYLGQWLRLTAEEGEREAVQRDRARGEFVGLLTDTPLHDPAAYDLTVNSARLSDAAIVEAVAALVAARSA
jgi:cytidylate kinase